MDKHIHTQTQTHMHPYSSPTQTHIHPYSSPTHKYTHVSKRTCTYRLIYMNVSKACIHPILQLKETTTTATAHTPGPNARLNTETNSSHASSLTLTLSLTLSPLSLSPCLRTHPFPPKCCFPEPPRRQYHAEGVMRSK